MPPTYPHLLYKLISYYQKIGHKGSQEYGDLQLQPDFTVHFPVTRFKGMVHNKYLVLDVEYFLKVNSFIHQVLKWGICHPKLICCNWYNYKEKKT